MNKLKAVDVFWDGLKVGRIALTKDSLCAFEYDPKFLRDGVSISPFQLPLRPGIFIANRQPFDGGFGVFDDSLPDGWGRLILERYLRKEGINPDNLTILAKLAYVGSTGRGALEFVPDFGVNASSSYANFDHLASEAARILENESYQGEGIEEFQLRGGSPGGARPKIFLKHEGREWLVKFRANTDPQDIGQIEYKYAVLARKCGLDMPEPRLFEDKYFGVERFDRIPNGKLHVISMAGLLNADYRIPSIDYEHLFKVGMALTNNISELWKIYRLMVFNFLIRNKDDHAKNFSFIYRNDGWHLAPPYDLLPSAGINGFHTTTINDSIEPKREDLISLAEKYSLDRTEAEKVFDFIQNQCSTTH